MSAIHPLLKPAVAAQHHFSELPKEEHSPVTPLEAMACDDSGSPKRDDNVEKRSCLDFLNQTPLERAGWKYLGGSNARSPITAEGLEKTGKYAEVQAVVLRLYQTLGRSVTARREMQKLGVFRTAGDLFISHSNPQIRCRKS